MHTWGPVELVVVYLRPSMPNAIYLTLPCAAEPPEAFRR